MDGYRLRVVLDFVRSRGRLPHDRWGNTLSPDDLLVWFGHERVLSPKEQEAVKYALHAMSEIETALDQIRSGPL